MFPAVWAGVVGRAASSAPATLPGYAALALRDEPYPGLVPRPGVETPGRLYRDLDEDAWEALDAFEGPEYERWQVVVRVGETPVAAQAYLLCPHARERLSTELWDAAAFASRNLDEFVRRLDW